MSNEDIQSYSVRTTAEIFDVAVTTIRDWCAQGKFPHAFKIGMQWRIPRSDIVAIAQRDHGDDQ